MSFLAPLFLGALAAVSLPVLLHLIRRTPRGQVLFSSLMFLSPTPPRLTKRSSIEHWLLMLLRATAVVLLALAFARPFLMEHAAADAEETGPGVHLAILIDTSASIKREDLWQQARAAAEAAAKELKPTDSLSLLTFDRQIKTIISPQKWNETPLAQRNSLFSDALQSLSPGWGATNLGDALIAAADSMGERTHSKNDQVLRGERNIVLISDLQEGGDLKSLDGFDWPSELKVRLSRVRVKALTNAGVQIVADRGAAGEMKESLRLRVTNAKGSARDQFTIRFEPVETSGGSVAPKSIDVYVPAGESRIIRTGDLTAWWSAAGNTVALEGDDHSFDNRAFHSASQPAEAVVVYVGDDEAKDTKGLRFYLDLAFPPTDRMVTRLVAVKRAQSLPPGETDGASLFVIDGLLPADRAAALRKRAEEGATLLIVLRDVADGESLAALLNSNAVTLREAQVRDYAMLSEIDFKHPLFAPFADPRFGDFTKIRFWKHRVLDSSTIEGGRVLAKFDDGSPALLEVSAGKGRCLVLASGWQPADGQFALSSKFVPLLNVLLQQSLGRPVSAARYVVGDAIDWSWLAASPVHRGKVVKIAGPQGQPLELGSDHRLTTTDEPGIYSASVGDETLRVAVNLAGSESDTAPLSADELERRGVKMWHSTTHLAGYEAEQRRQMRMNELENKHKLWRWLIVAAIGLLMIETFVAGRIARKSVSSET